MPVISPAPRPTLVQQTVQYAFLAYFIHVGLSFLQYARWAMGLSPEYAARPASVEAFLPIGALMGLKRLLYTGLFDPVHPAGLTILLMALTTAFLWRKGFCGYLCPVGAVSMSLERMGRRLGIARSPGKWLNLLLTLPKYPLLLWFLSLIVNMSVPDIEAFTRGPYYQVADTRMLLFFWHPGTALLVCLGVLVLGGLLFPGFWCRGLCPYGALLGLFSMLSPVAVRREESSCTGCRRCTRVCPSRITVHEKKRISGPECVGCVRCLNACPEPDCLSLRLGYTRRAPRLPFWSIAAGTLMTVFLLHAWAVWTGHWDVELPPEMIRMNHRNIMSLQHF